MKKFKSQKSKRKFPAPIHDNFSSLYRVQDEPPESFKTKVVRTQPSTQTLLG